MDARCPAPTLRDAVYGLAVGDALGVPYEFRPRGTFECTGMTGHGTHGKPAGTWSDDTSMALALCDSYRELGRVDAADVRRRFERWYRRGDYTVDGLFDVGGATARALELGRGMAGERDNGNGSLMRTAPLAFTDATDAQVEAVSAVTHAHPTSTRACVELVRVARRLAAGSPVEEALGDDLAREARRGEADVRSGGYVLDTLHAAAWCLANTDGYAACVLKAVNLGDDTDTTAAVAGALAGIAYGAASIPAAWMDALRGKDVIEACLF
jgi:ADP-ribosylglycohydrolase